MGPHLAWWCLNITRRYRASRWQDHCQMRGASEARALQPLASQVFIQPLVTDILNHVRQRPRNFF